MLNVKILELLLNSQYNSSELKAIQAPIKEAYKKIPEKAALTLTAVGKIGEGISCKLETGRASIQAGLHPKTGGSGMAVCSGDMLLEALAACAGVTLSAVATAMDITISDGSVIVEGDLDFRGTLGVDKTVPVGFTEIRIRFDIQSSATEEQLNSLYKLTERYCVVYQTLQKPPKINFQRKEK